MSLHDDCRLEHGVRLHRAGRLDAARAVYESVLEDDPAQDEGLHLLGLIAYQRGDARGAIEAIGQAIALRPDAAHYRCNLGNALRQIGRLDEAAAALRIARSLRPDSAEIASNLGAVLTEHGDFAGAIETLRAAVALDRSLVDARYNLANALCGAGDAAAALGEYGACLRLRPGFADAHFNLGHALAGLGRPEEAERSLLAAIAHDPDHADAHNNLGALRQLADRVDEAEASYRQALRTRPDHAEALCNLGAVLLAQDRRAEAAACFDEVLARHPHHGAARLGRLMSHLAIVPCDEAEVAQSREAYSRALADVIVAARDPTMLDSLRPAVGRSQPFFLAYQGEDDRDLQAAFGELMCRAAPLAAPPRSRRGAKIRVGIVSGFFRDHTVWTLLIHGWLTQLDRERFEVFGYHTGTRRDDRTLLAAQWCDRFADMLGPVAEWRARVLDDAPDVLLYPEIGMDPVAAGLAAQRLAPVQCVAWGHPVTSGLPSIDYFLSGALMEPDAGPSHYTETLVRLPNLGAYVEPDAPPPPTLKRRCEFGLREGAAVFWSGQNLPKYHPRHDGVFARIAQAVPDSQFVFIAYGHGTAATEAFAARLAAAFSTFGLDALRHCVILPQMAQADFLAAASLCDIVLDTIGWSGGRSTLDLLAIDPVVVTLPGRFLRGRHTAAILRMIGATETVADSVDGYVDLAVRLAQQPAFRARVRGDVAARKHRVARDRAAIDALEGFLASVAANQPPRESSETPP